MDRDFLYFFIFGIFFQFIFIFKNEGRKKICLESKKNQEKKVVEEIREGSIVRRAEDDSLYKFLGVAKNTSSCEYEVVLMALSGDFGLYTVSVKDFTKIADFGSHQNYAYETCGNVDGNFSIIC